MQYIKSLRKQGDIEKLRIAREAMSAMFPLSSEMWKEWIKDEMSLSSGYCFFTELGVFSLFLLNNLNDFICYISLSFNNVLAIQFLMGVVSFGSVRK